MEWKRKSYSVGICYSVCRTLRCCYLLAPEHRACLPENIDSSHSVVTKDQLHVLRQPLLMAFWKVETSLHFPTRFSKVQ